MAVKALKPTKPMHRALLPGVIDASLPALVDVAREIFVQRVASSASRAVTTPHVAQLAFEDARAFISEARRQLAERGAESDAEPDESPASYLKG